MFFRQYQYRIGSFCYRQSPVSFKSHHRATDKIDWVLNSRSPSLPDRLLNRTSQGQPYRNRVLHFAHNRYQLILHRTSQRYGTVHIVHRLHIEYCYAAFNRKTAGRNYLSCHFINQYHFVPGRIYLIQKPEPYLRIFPNAVKQRSYRLLICFLYPDNGLLRPHTLCYHMKSPHDFICILLQKLPMQF